MSNKTETPEVEAPKEPSLQESISKGITEGMAVVAAMMAKQQAPAPAAKTTVTAAAVVTDANGNILSRFTRCSDCGQIEAACKRDHRLAVIFPQDEESARFFDGIKMNGVRYRSNGPNHYVMVPKDSNMEYDVAAFERGEKRNRMGKNFKLGSGGGGSNNFNAYSVGGYDKK